MTHFFSDKYHYIDLYQGDCIDVMDKLISDGVTVDLTVTSPPYDMLRTYENQSTWNFEVFKQIADRLYKLTRDGGIVVWVVGDATIKGCETGSSFKQALYFMDLGFKLHDTMIYEKCTSTFPARRDSKRYTQIFEYMFVFCKGEIRKDIELIADKENKWAGYVLWGKHNHYSKEGTKVETSQIKPIPQYSLRNNIWRYVTGYVTSDDKTDHPAVFPEKLAEDNILSWSVEGDMVFDPFLGSGTTGKMAILNNRKFIGAEICDKYYDIAKERILKYDAPKKLTLFKEGVPTIFDSPVEIKNKKREEKDENNQNVLPLW